MDEILKIENLKKYFVKKSLFSTKVSTVRATDDVSFTIQRGEVFVLAGESGSGKSTIAKLILRVFEPDSGKIIFENEEITNSAESLKKIRLKCQMIHQDPYDSINPRMKVFDIIYEPLEIHKLGTKEERKKRVFDVLKEVKLEPVEEISKLYPHMLSGGQRQRVVVARALAVIPKMIIADEPVSMLDVSIRAELLELLSELRKKYNISFLYITHDLATAKFFGQKIAILYLGKIVETGPIDEVLLHPKHPYTQALIDAISEPDPENLAAKESQERTETRTLHEENARLKEEQHEIEVNLHSLEKQLTASNQELVGLREKEQEIISTSGSSVSQVKEYDTKLASFNDREKSLAREINGIDRQSDSIQRDLKDLYEKETSTQKIIDTYGLDETIEGFDVNQILQPLYAEQRSLTEINAKAPSTYVIISDGYRSMSARRNSLEEERTCIVRFIEAIEKDKRQTFLDAFDIVDKEIHLIFSKMTGGNAWLELQNEDDIFSSGISYMIQFQNKPKRESTSISGGEKTLAAVVFVLALQKLKPSPFYLFDEIDAHLDAPNAEKLGKILEERARESQFLMVSLKDSIVQRAKLIYGVFPKNGVSHVVIYKDKRLPSMTT